MKKKKNPKCKNYRGDDKMKEMSKIPCANCGRNIAAHTEAEHITCIIALQKKLEER